MPITAYITHPSCLLHEMGAGHPECPERLASINDHMIALGLDGHVARLEAPRATREQLGRVHLPAYVDAIESPSFGRPRTQHFDFDTSNADAGARR